MSMTLLILLLILFGLILIRVKPGWALLSLGIAVVLFVNTPAGKPLPGSIASFIQDAGSATAPLTGSGPRTGGAG